METVQRFCEFYHNSASFSSQKRPPIRLRPIWRGAMDNSLSLGTDQLVKFQQAVTTATVISSSKFAELPTALATVEPRFTGNRVTR